MKRKILLFLTTLFVLSACNLTSSYGKKVKINESLEIYMKGDQVTENDAKQLGNYLAELWKDAHNEKSLQLQKEGSVFVVRMVVDEKMVKADTSLNSSFMAVKSLLETDVFKDSKVKFIITDNEFNDIKSY
jgi:hypothetical protein